LVGAQAAAIEMLVQASATTAANRRALARRRLIDCSLLVGVGHVASCVSRTAGAA
jgi:hypothetical protein